MDTNADELKAAVEAQYGAAATLFYVAHVIGLGPGGWDGLVHVFDLDGHPKAARAYAWSFPSPNGVAPQVHTALHADGMRGAHDAVLFTIKAA